MLPGNVASFLQPSPLRNQNLSNEQLYWEQLCYSMVPLSSFVKQRIVINGNQHILCTYCVIRLCARHFMNITSFNPHGSPIVGKETEAWRLRTCLGHTAGICTQVIPKRPCVTTTPLPWEMALSGTLLASIVRPGSSFGWPEWPLKLCRPAQPSLQPWSPGSWNPEAIMPLWLGELPSYRLILNIHYLATVTALGREVNR